MRVFIMGGTGLLGYHATLALLNNGHQVTNLSSGSFRPGDWYPSDVELTYGDVFSLSLADLEERLRGYDVLVYALGPDDRIAPPAPAYDFFFERLVLTAEKACKAARSAGIRRVVVLNSYLAYFHRKNPAWQLAERHPYIRCRVEQAASCLDLATDEFTVMVFEIPYVFGTMPERTLLWEKVLMPRIRWMRPWIFFPSGGTVMASANFIGRAVCGALTSGESGRHPIGEQNMCWKAWLAEITLAHDGRARRVITMPTGLAQLYGKYEQLSLALQGREGGLNYGHYMRDIQSKYTFFPEETMDQVAASLNIERGTVHQAIYETFSRSG